MVCLPDPTSQHELAYKGSTEKSRKQHRNMHSRFLKKAMCDTITFSIYFRLREQTCPVSTNERTTYPINEKKKRHEL